MNDLVLSGEDEFSGGGDGFLAYLPAILWQRRWWMIVPVVVGIVASIAAALLIPPSYQATAIMLVQSSQLPDEVVGEFNNSVIDRRIAAIRQRVISRPDLLELINRHGLYSDRRSSDPLSEIIEDMRESITLIPSTIEGGDPSRAAFR